MLMGQVKMTSMMIDTSKEAIRLLEQPVGGNILGHVDRIGRIIRFDKISGAFAKGHPLQGVLTFFVPDKYVSLVYYNIQLEEDMKHGGRR